MKKIRINELARELEVKAHEILDRLPELGVSEKKTHSSSIDEDVAVRLRQIFGHGNGEPAIAREPSEAEAAEQAAEAARPQAPVETEVAAPGSSRGGASRYIPRAVRRAVAERDGYRCAYVSPTGQRCESVSGLQYHHLKPFARRGESTVAGVVLMCAVHNDLQARLDFGEAHMAAAKARSRAPKAGQREAAKLEARAG